MPYSSARYWMFVVIGVIIVGFWPSYWSVVGNVPWQFHMHGAAASVWVAMLTVQCWTSQSKRQLDLHRTVGRASLFLFPFLIAGLAAIMDVATKHALNPADPFGPMFGPAFSSGVLPAPCRSGRTARTTPDPSSPGAA